MKNRIAVFLLAVLTLGCGVKLQDEVPGSADTQLDCGVVVNDELATPDDVTDGSTVIVSAVYSTNTLAIQFQKDDGSFAPPVLIKLQGVSDLPLAKRETAINRLESLATGPMYFFRAKKDCTTTASGGGAGLVGALLASNGISLNEEMIRTGLGDVQNNDACGGELLNGCFQQIYGTTLETAGDLGEFLWKPVSDSNGDLAVHTGPYGTDVYVNGEKGQNQGGGNGYGSLARFSRPGCSYPSPQIQVYDGNSGLPYTVGGAVTFTVPNPCGRFCLIDGTIQECSK